MIIDNSFIDIENQNKIKNILLSDDFPWYFSPSTVGDYYKTNSIDYPFFYHVFYKEMNASSPHFPLILELFNKFMEKNNIGYRSIIRAKVNLNPKRSKNEILPPHLDYGFDHNVFLYYVNDSDGDTLFFNEKDESLSLENLTIKEKIAPKMGTAVVFDGKTLHSPSTPKDNEYRMTINIVFV